MDTDTDIAAAVSKISSAQSKKRGEDSRRHGAAGGTGSRKASIDTSATGLVNKPVVKLENTYKLGPDDNKKFRPYMIESNIYELLKEKLNNCEKANPSGYNAKACAALTNELNDSIRREVKNLVLPRYRIVTYVNLGENLGQDVRVTSRCLWNPELDNHVSISYKTKNIWANCVVFVVYTD